MALMAIHITNDSHMYYMDHITVLDSVFRFGRALAKLRTRHAARIRAQARDLVKKNLLKYGSTKRCVKGDAQWRRAAELESIFDFLA